MVLSSEAPAERPVRYLQFPVCDRRCMGCLRGSGLLVRQRFGVARITTVLTVL